MHACMHMHGSGDYSGGLTRLKRGSWLLEIGAGGDRGGWIS